MRVGNGADRELFGWREEAEFGVGLVDVKFRS